MWWCSWNGTFYVYFDIMIYIQIILVSIVVSIHEMQYIFLYLNNPCHDTIWPSIFLSKHCSLETKLGTYEWNEGQPLFNNPQLLENMIQHICFSSPCIVLFYRMFLNEVMIKKFVGIFDMLNLGIKLTTPLIKRKTLWTICFYYSLSHSFFY